MHPLLRMDPTNPRWESAEARRDRSASFWKLVVTAATASAFTAVIVASCLDRDDEAQRDLMEPTVVETTAGTPSGTGAPVSTSTADSVGGVAASPAPSPAAGATAPPMLPGPVPTTNVTNSTTVITSGEVERVQQSSGRPEQNYSPKPVPFETATPDAAAR
jgi:hypothetical protein